MFNVTLEREFALDEAESEERAVRAMLHEPAVSYLCYLRRMIEQDPAYLDIHIRAVCLMIQDLLSSRGIFWDDAVLVKQVRNVVSRGLAMLGDPVGKVALHTHVTHH